MQYLYHRSEMGTSATCHGNTAADMGETSSCKQTSMLTLSDFSGREDPPMDNVALCSEEHTFAMLFEEL